MQEYKAHIFPARSDESSHDRLDELRQMPNVQISDTIEMQVFELLKCRNPKLKISKTSKIYQQLLEDYLQGNSYDSIGNWVFFPWNNNLVHILCESEFIEVRTNRNKYKITHEQQVLLSTKKVGVIGLSVGKTVAITMAMERMFGEIRLADFDEIELSNLNRIRTSLINMATNKSIIVAREIAEFDPYLKTVVYEDGITEENIDDFFSLDGNLDMLVEECDGLDIKIIARQKAKSLGIPVVMETNDRAMLDIERFDLEPERPILHGLVENLDVETLKTLKTNEDKVPYMLKMIGIDDTSVSLRASMLEIEQSISTWPQLASSVVTGGGLVASISRRILLGENVLSGRYYSDFETVASDTSSKSQITYHKDAVITPIDYKKLIESVDVPSHPGQIELSESQLKQLVDDILIAPSAANNQPWTWLYKNGQLFLYHNTSRGKSYWDQEHIAAALSLGCALENLKISSTALGVKLHSIIKPNNLGIPDKPIGHFWFEQPKSPIVRDELFPYLTTRRTNRLNIESHPIENQDFETIRRYGDSSPFKFIVIEENDLKSKIGELLGQLEQIRLVNPNGHRDFVNEVRWSKEEARAKRDGIDINTINLTATEHAGFTISKNSEVVQKLRQWKGGSGFGDIITKGIDLSPGLVIMYGDSFENSTKLKAGQLFERLWLTLTKLKLEMHPLTSIAVLPNVAKMESSTISDYERNKLNQINDSLIQLLKIPANSRFFMAFRLFKGENSPVTALRLDKTSCFYQHSK